MDKTSLYSMLATLATLIFFGLFLIVSHYFPVTMFTIVCIGTAVVLTRLLYTGFYSIIKDRQKK